VNSVGPAPAIVTENLTKIYLNHSHPPVQAVNGVGLTVAAGEIVLISGPNGSGKTTLLSMIGCLLKPNAGMIRICGRDVTAFDQGELADFRLRHIGFVFQNFRLLDSLSVMENVELPLNLAGIRRPESRERARAALEDLKISHRARFYPNVLSGGERQRAAIARALVNDPGIILADEPTGSLDSVAGRAAVEYLSAAARKRNKAVVIVGHDERIRSFADRVITMEDGRVKKEERP
jgi:putative ABC transport system ATP-binding protein